ncbi:Alpha/Beta hydrolase protein [Microdochium trichocladiopsis]|uniref:Alpha/Beta hydrolase protein n=1 Tax=Microdochium trichocladiopsis TaxID=1682393 RepID=A0A9P9BP12_9PEZI|nr:Alpha/Beta hydrolase protein [Microdochium trichocladiopsis]KAH7032649.1 Alpha/Beta hydrolase protein [Microdochium trichocladiopsis]
MYVRISADGCVLAFQSSLPLPASKQPQTANPSYDRCIVLMHGFSGSSEYFTRNFAALAQHHWVVAPDMRGHGRSGRPTGGHHVARLAADLKSLLRFLVQQTRATRVAAGQQPRGIQFIPVGCSIGAAVLWTYAELFGHGTHDADALPGGGGDDSLDLTSTGSFAGYIFVDQAPLQDRVPSFMNSGSGTGGDTITWDTAKSHTGCYDEATMHAAQRAWIHDTANAHKGLVAECLGYRFSPSASSAVRITADQARADEDFFTRISSLCDPVWLARLLADHTRYDHRDAIREVVSEKPVLVMAGGLSGCFPREGLLETARIVNGVVEGGAEASVYEDAGHWLFYEDPVRFRDEVVRFIDKVTAA